MSLILDALNRARQDDNPVPGLSTYHPVDQVSVNRKQYSLWVALSVAVVLIAWLIVERYSAPQLPGEGIDIRADNSSVAREAPVVSGEPAAGRDQPIAVEPLPPVTAGNELPEPDIDTTTQAVQSSLAAVSSLAEDATQAEAVENRARMAPGLLPEEAGSPSVSDAGLEAEPESGSAPEENSAVAELYRNPPTEPVYRKPATQAAARATENGGNADASLDVSKMVQMAREEARNIDLIDSSVPLLIDLSQQIKDSIPTIYYLRHDYSSNASSSTVVLNSKTLSVGDSAAAGMQVEEILPDSVVLNYQGTQFRLRALNSWINL